jgi:hypothetical protein
MHTIDGMLAANIDRNKRFEGIQSKLEITQTVRDILSGRLYPEILNHRNGNARFAMMEQDTAAAYISNGWITLEEVTDIITGRSSKRISEYFNQGRLLPQWLEYINSTLELLVPQVDISLEEFHNQGLDTNGKEQARKIIELYFPHLVEQFQENPDIFKFRYVSVDEAREEQFGDIQSNILKYGVDFDLSRGWYGIWSRAGTIYGSGFRPSGKENYLLIYNDPQGLMEGPGYYTENAMCFIRLVMAEKTLKDLLSDGGVLKVVKAEES